MDRLTRRSDYDVAVICDNCPRHGNCNIPSTCLNVLADCLAAYEDTGLTPEVINKWAVAVMFFEDADTNKLIELADAEKEGRLIVLPCKVGDTVYLTTHNGKVTKGTAVSFRFREKLMVDIEYNHFGTYATSRYWGETVFLTREEAEAALEEKE